MPSITLNDALARPQAKYLTIQEAGISKDEVISAGMNALIITNRTSLLPVPHTDGFSTCMCIAVENTKTGTIALTHVPEYRKEALIKMLKLSRRSQKDKLNIYLIGACYDYYDENEPDPEVTARYAQKWRKEWPEEMQGIIDVINSSPNTELITFDVGHKPHPDSVGFCRDASGKTHLIRGSVDYISNEAIDNPTRAQTEMYCGAFHNVETPRIPEDFRQTAEEPFYLTWDGRLPENQDWEKNPRAKKAADKSTKPHR